MSLYDNKDTVEHQMSNKKKEMKKHRTSRESKENLKAESLRAREGVYPLCADRRLAVSNLLLAFDLCALSNRTRIPGNAVS